jgi:hypothetical protein
VYKHKEALLLNGLNDLTGNVPGNEMRGAKSTQVSQEYLRNVTAGTNAICTMPLPYRDTIWGVLSVESKTTITQTEAEEIRSIAEALTGIAWKLENYKKDRRSTESAIKTLQDELGTMEAGVLNPKTGYLVNFGAKSLIKIFKTHMETHNFELDEVVIDWEKGNAVKIIENAIREYEFGVFILSEISDQYCLEIGMALMSKRPLIVFCEDSDEARELKLPTTKHFHSYLFSKHERDFNFSSWGREDRIELEQIVTELVEALS